MQSYLMSQFRPSLPISLLVNLRWIALLGQSITLGLIDRYFGMIYPKGLTWSIVGLSIGVNLMLTLSQKSKRKIPPSHLYLYLIYDIGQLFSLLYVTGGLNNPFTVFLLAPVVIAACFLRRRDALVVTGVGLIVTAVLYGSSFPLPWYSMGLVLPEQLRFAVLVAIGVAMIFIAIYVGRVADNYFKTNQALQATELALAREQKLASLGALAAAAAHELGSPLTTMMLVIKELAGVKALPRSVGDDIQILSDQTHRCRDILQSLSRNYAADDHALPFKSLPLSAALDVIISTLNIDDHKQVKAVSCGEQPIIELTPDLQHAFGNIIANAVQFSRELVQIYCSGTLEQIRIKVCDDGLGFAEPILKKLGKPYISSRAKSPQEVHLGLGLFIAQTLIEKKGGVVYFYNEAGAVCEIVFPRDVIEVPYGSSRN